MESKQRRNVDDDDNSSQHPLLPPIPPWQRELNLCSALLHRCEYSLARCIHGLSVLLPFSTTFHYFSTTDKSGRWTTNGASHLKRYFFFHILLLVLNDSLPLDCHFTTSALRTKENRWRTGMFFILLFVVQVLSVFLQQTACMHGTSAYNEPTRY